MRLLARARNFGRRPRFMQGWIVPLWLLLGVARLGIGLLPFATIARRLGDKAPPGAMMKSLDAGQRHRAGMIADSIRVTARTTPWTSDCYPQAVAGAMLLRFYRLPYRLTFGVRDDAATAGMAAHCWLESGDVMICGGGVAGDFKPVACFVHGSVA